MANNYYYVVRKSNHYDKVIIDYSKLMGFDVTPKNNIDYGGIIVNRLVIIKKCFIEKILKKKIKRKLEVYLQFIIDYIDSEEESGGTLNEVLSDLTRYKDIVNYRYRKYLGNRYIDLLLRKINLLEHEFKVKLYELSLKQNTLGENNLGSKSR